MDVSAAANARLEAARGHYARALALDPENLRSRLGYAYVLDRLGRTSDARRELRCILKKGLPRLNGETSEWEDHAVLTETAAHLEHLATSRGDRAKMQRLRERLEASRPAIYVTPIVVPLIDAPFAEMIDNGSAVAFDFAGTGDTRASGWITPNAAWLVWDPEWRGQVRSGFDMIGQRTWSVFWSDGFEAMRALDDNRDGELTGVKCRRQRGSHCVVKHGGQETALNIADVIGEFRFAIEFHFNRAVFGGNRSEKNAESSRRRWRRRLPVLYSPK